VAGSKRYKSLCEQVEALRRYFLPSKLSPTGTYAKPSRVSAHSLGYRILCVAEIENYLEDRCVQIAKTALDSWKTNNNFSLPLQSITVFSEVKFEALPAYLVPKKKDQKDWDNLVSPNKRIEKSIDEYIHFVEVENHGIREKNLISLLIPIGVDLRKLDQTFLSRIDSLGTKRGDAAHTSCSMALKVGVDPSVERTEIDAIITDMLDLDQRLDELLAFAEAPIVEEIDPA
jgi:hypothetical protein